MNTIKTQYVEQLNKIKRSKTSGTSADEVYKPAWWLYECLAFMKPHVVSRKGESSFQMINSMPSETNTELEYPDVVRALRMKSIELAEIIDFTDDPDVVSSLAPIEARFTSTTSQAANKSQNKSNERDFSPVPSTSSKRASSQRRTISETSKEDFWNNMSNAMKLI